MSEQQAEYITEAMAMLGQGYSEPAAIIEEPRTRKVMGMLPGFDDQDTAAWVKLSTAFKPHIKALKGAPLAVWLYLSLSINRQGIAFPSISTMADDLGYSRQGVMEAITTLEEKKYLQVTRGKRRYNLYQPGFAANGKGKEPVNSVDSSNNESTFSPNESTFSPNESSGVDLNKKNKKNKNAQENIFESANKTVDAILENERKSQGRQWTSLPEIYQSYGKVFQEETGIIYTKKQAMDWLDTIGEWMTCGYKPEDVRVAVRQIREDGQVSISRPGSITWKLRANTAAKHTKVPPPPPLPVYDTSKFVPAPPRPEF